MRGGEHKAGVEVMLRSIHPALCSQSQAILDWVCGLESVQSDADISKAITILQCCCPQCCIILKTAKLGSCKTRLSAKTKFVAVNYCHTFLVELAEVAMQDCKACCRLYRDAHDRQQRKTNKHVQCRLGNFNSNLTNVFRG